MGLWHRAESAPIQKLSQLFDSPAGFTTRQGATNNQSKTVSQFICQQHIKQQHQAARPANMANIKSLADLNGEGEGDDNGKFNDYYAGGEKRYVPVWPAGGVRGPVLQQALLPQACMITPAVPFCPAVAS